MVWHIFRKDWKLQWKLFLAVVAIQFLPAIIRVKLGLFGEDPTLEYLLAPLGYIVIVASALLTVVIVQQDSIPSSREDWLTRPVRRSDLLLAKLFFAVVLVQSAVLSADTFLGIATGFSVGPAFSAALAHNLYWLAVVTLPAFMLASITRNMTEAIVAGVLGFCGASAILILSIVVRGGQAAYIRETIKIGEAWVALYASHLLVLLGACAVLGLQYFRRKTTATRWLAGTLLLLFVAVQQFLPWKVMFAVERRMSPNPSADRSLTLAFDPSVGRFQDPSGVRADDGTKPEAYLPVQVEGLPKDTVLQVDKSEVRITDSSGHIVYRGEEDTWEFRGTGAAKSAAYQKLALPGSLYERFKDRPLLLEFDYSITLLRVSSTYAVPALHGDLRKPGLGICATETNETGTAVELRCRQAGNSPTCRSAFLLDTATSRQNPEMYRCEPDYSPSLERANRTPLSSYGVNLPFRDPAGLTHYPVEGPQLPKSSVMVSLYEQVDHFSRHLIIPSVRLAEWGIQ
jgi:hypothetical protein